MNRATEFLFGSLACLAFALLIVWVLVNWLTGCGETFPTASGALIAGDCIGPLELFGLK